MGSIKIRTHDGKLCTLNEVRHVPHTTKNLISRVFWTRRGLVSKVKVELYMFARVQV
jgi:hypothetical protein